MDYDYALYAAALIVTFAAALVILAYYRNRTERAAYIATLSDEQREELRGFESAGCSWELFRDVRAAK